MSETNFEQATRMLRQWYYDEIRDLAKEALTVDEEDRDEWMHDRIDGHGFVIYTHLAQAVILSSRNDSAMEEETGKVGTDAQRAYYAMLADLREAIG